VLLEAGAQSTVRDRWGCTPYDDAVRNGDRGVIEMLEERVSVCVCVRERERERERESTFTIWSLLLVLVGRAHAHTRTFVRFDCAGTCLMGGSSAAVS
jgi:hypothetical protein